ncbi:MAG: CBS domain-containing protein [Candidatus Binatia bacterium]
MTRPKQPGRKCANSVGALPVCDGERIHGVITDRDLAIRLVAEGRDPARTRVSDIMTPGVSYCFDDQSVEEAVMLMEAEQIRRLPILNREKQLVGMLSLGDLAIRTEGTEDEDLADGALKDISEPSEPNR